MGTVVFDGAFDKGSLGYENFEHRIHPERITRVDDPAGVRDSSTGAVRKVLQFKVHEADIGPTENPRAQLETPYFWPKGTTYFIGHSLMYGSNWPEKLTSYGWVSTGGGGPWAPPFDGPGPVGNRLESSPGYVTQRMNSANSTNWPAGSRPTVAYQGPTGYSLRGKWIDRITEYHTGDSVNDMRGYIRQWENAGSGWVPRVFYEGTTRETTKLALSNPDTSSRDYSKGRVSISNYYKRACYGSDRSLTVYHGHFKIGTSMSAVMPRSYEHAAPTP